jgi:hypothetical protein
LKKRATKSWPSFNKSSCRDNWESSLERCIKQSPTSNSIRKLQPPQSFGLRFH